jgi:hypothetical protein
MKYNFVAKHARKYNTAKVFDNRKAKAKRGYSKHKYSLPDESYRGRNVTHCDVVGFELWGSIPLRTRLGL